MLFRGTYKNIKNESVSWSRTYLSLKCINDKLQGLRLHTLNTLLHHMITILVFHAFQDMAIQLPYHLILLGGEKDKQKAPPGFTADKCKVFIAKRNQEYERYEGCTNVFQTGSFPVAKCWDEACCATETTKKNTVTKLRQSTPFIKRVSS